MELNKILAGVLVAVLVVIGISNLSDVLYHQEPLAQNAYVVEVEDATAAAGAVAAVVEDLPSLGELLAVADASKGAKVFKKCAACHSVDNGGAHKTGPNLYNIVGAAKAGKAGFSYSSALADMDGEWSYENLDAFLKKPKDYAPGTKMAFAGLKKPEQRAALIAYLRENSDVPLALPAALPAAE